VKKIFVKFLFALIVAGATHLPAQTPGTQPASSQPAASQKVIKDPAEYNAYIAAVNTQDPAAKGAAMEAFVSQYPGSVVKLDALEQAMAAYQQAGNQEKVLTMAKRILEINAGHVRALAIVAYIDRARATQGDAAALKESCVYGEKGLAALPAWQKPDGVSDSDFEKMRNQMSDIFNGVAGFCALQAKDYATARSSYLKSVQIDPGNMQDIYQLGIADMLMSPMDVTGFWYLAKAINIATAQNNAPAAQGIATYAKAQYRRYHGGEDGWDPFVAAVANQAAPPVAISDAIKPRPTNCEIAADAVAKNKVDELSFSDWEFILAQRDCGPQGKDAADKVWQAIQGKEKGGQAMLRISVMVIAAAADSLDVAVTDENQQAKKADMHVAMQKPMLHAPAAGSMTDVVGVITSYTLAPFMFTMEKGALAAAAEGGSASPQTPADPKK
jgi:tetratricopeptide (TPR) repeat protein